MKTLDDYMQLPYSIEIIQDADDGSFVAFYPALLGCLSSGKTAEDAKANALKAKRAWMEAALANGFEIPAPTSRKEYSGQLMLRIPTSLYKSLEEQSRLEGVSMNQYCIYLLTKSNTEKQL